eukprot:TRINITY_DN5658_c0_g1_i1.p1 TRINITY_DN5658_c0_g1~~TRINITY_DN5658_c0_g1_i1.p1  ORF type:complete len:177 (-),score=39.93 TRINITY_DN5658_c0_g1_i1:194-724(-)
MGNQQSNDNIANATDDNQKGTAVAQPQVGVNVMDIDGVDYDEEFLKKVYFVSHGFKYSPPRPIRVVEYTTPQVLKQAPPLKPLELRHNIETNTHDNRAISQKENELRHEINELKSTIDNSPIHSFQGQIGKASCSGFEEAYVRCLGLNSNSDSKFVECDSKYQELRKCLASSSSQH